MNCKPNELAFIVRGMRPEFLGKIVTTHYLAPKGVFFNLPDGWGHGAINVTTPEWVCEFPSDIAAPLVGGGSPRLTRFACVPDKCLKPIRGDEEPEATETSYPLEKKISLEGVET